MILWGWAGMSHDASLAVYKDNEIVYASHSERYSRNKNDKNLNWPQIKEAMQYGMPDKVFFYEDLRLKKLRQLWAGQFKLLTKQSPATYLQQFGITCPIVMTKHHKSHAAYAYYTDPIQVNTDILVIDSIGEFETMSVWNGNGGKLTKRWSQSYPHSVGLWYSAMTQRLGLMPQEHEYILMGMAAMGDPNKFYDMIVNDFFSKLPTKYDPSVKFKKNLHRGCMDWRPEITTVMDLAHVAAAVQKVYEDILIGVLQWMKQGTHADRVALVGGCALNCVANTLAFKVYDSVWVPPNPGDAGSSVGAILAHVQEHKLLPSPFIGTDIVGQYPTSDLLSSLLSDGVGAVASGRAEFGPRALGHRSLLADPRIRDIKDRINKIKRREEFRPFAPMILEEEVGNYFELPSNNFTAPFMQFAVKCKNPTAYPGIVHVDGTSRVQTVDKDCGGPRELLEAWFAKTGCPMLLNTSLNIKGEPLVNTKEDANRWTNNHGVTVRTSK
jgi:carbamoyltransferase